MATSEDPHLQSTAARPPDKGWVINMEKKTANTKNVLNREHCFRSKEVTKEFEKEKKNVLQVPGFCWTLLWDGLEVEIIITGAFLTGAWG